MSLPVKSFEEIVSQQISAMLAVASPTVLDFSIGSDFLALVESNAGLFLWSQALTTGLLAVTRLSTSTEDVDVDTYINDFGFFRYLGNPSSGNVIFSRFTTTSLGTIPVGTLVSVSTVNNLNFSVILDTSNPNYDPISNSYLIQIGTGSISVPVVCQTNGTIGNVAVGKIDTINTILTGVSTVTNTSVFTNGVDIWSNDKTKAEFVSYIQSLSRATKGAIDFAVSSTPGVERFISVENQDPNGDPHLGFFFVVIDDGTGNASPQLIANVAANVELYRGFTIAYEIIAPTTVTVNVSFTLNLQTNPTETHAVITSNVQTAIQNYIIALSFGALLPYTRLAELIYDADSNITNVKTILLNGGTSDLQATNLQIFIPGTITVNYA